VDIRKDLGTMTVKAIARTCYGSAFNDEKECQKMFGIFQEVYCKAREKDLIAFLIAYTWQSIA